MTNDFLPQEGIGAANVATRLCGMDEKHYTRIPSLRSKIRELVGLRSKIHKLTGLLDECMAIMPHADSEGVVFGDQAWLSQDRFISGGPLTRNALLRWLSMSSNLRARIMEVVRNETNI